MNRRPATAEDLTIGATVYKGSGKTAWKVTQTGISGGRAYVVVCKASTFDSNRTGGGSLQSPELFTVEA